MDCVELKTRIESASEGSHALDSDIAKMLGWKEVRETLVDSDTGSSRKKFSWYPPGSGSEANVPKVTSDVNAAMTFLRAAAPKEAGAVAWENGLFRVTLEHFREPLRARTLPLALCRAAVEVLDEDQRSLDHR